MPTGGAEGRPTNSAAVPGVAWEKIGFAHMNPYLLWPPALLVPVSTPRATRGIRKMQMASAYSTQDHMGDVHVTQTSVAGWGSGPPFFGLSSHGRGLIS